MADKKAAFGFNTPFAEQLDFFRKKLNLPTARWDDITREQHDKAFIVAGAQKADLLKDLNAAVTKAIEQGTGLEAFRKDFAAIVQRHGWTGWTGEGSQAGVAWRTKVIYQTNLATSYAAGRYQQLTDPDFLKLRPYWRYVHNDSVLHPRPQHQHWGDTNLTLPHDHPFWSTHFPPNGWGCMCHVTAVAGPQDGDATDPPRGWDQRNDLGRLPGIDSGFDYTPGKNVVEEMRAMVAGKVATLPGPLGQALAQNAAPVLAPAVSVPTTVEEFLAAGKRIVDSLPDGGIDPLACHQALVERLAAEVGISTPCVTASKGLGAQLVQAASQLFPDSWTAVADNLGPLHVKAKASARGFHYTEKQAPPYPGARYKLPEFGTVAMEQGAGYVHVRTNALANAVHEFSHRLQAALPKLDALFEELHQRRTVGDPLERLRDVTKINYASSEVTRKDKYADPYQGKEYSGKPLEVMTMAMEAVLGAGGKALPGWKDPAQRLRDVYTKDKEMVDFTVGLLFHWKP